MKHSYFAVPVATAAVGVIALSGCSSSTSHAAHAGPSSAMAMSSPAAVPSTASHNTADVTFTTDMLPHHRQAVEMSALAATRASDQRVKTLAAAITKEQDPEITTMTGLLAAWGQPAPSASGTDMGGMDMGGHGTGTGMMSGAEMTQLEKSSGSAFDRLWVTLMTKHHQGAVAMAKAELADGSSARAKQLATSIITGQSKEIATMRTLLQSLPTS